MKIDNIVAGVALFGLGIPCGFWACGHNYAYEDIIKYLRLIFAAIALIIAGIALYTWRHQFSHNEKYRCSVELESNFKKLLRASRVHWSDSLKLSRDSNKPYEREKLASFKSYTKAYVNYLDSWDYMSSHVGTKKINPLIKPNKLQSKLNSLFTPIQRVNVEHYDPATESIDFNYDSLLKDGLKEIRSYRKYS